MDNEIPNNPGIPISPIATNGALGTPSTTPSISNPVEYYFQSTLTSFELLVHGQELNAVNILTLCISLMQMIEQYPSITGPQKKELALKVFDKYVENHGGQAAPFLALLPSFIDTSVNLDKGNIAINMSVADAQEHAVGCCLALLTSTQRNSPARTSSTRNSSTRNSSTSKPPVKKA